MSEKNWLQTSFSAQMDELRVLISMYPDDLAFIDGFSVDHFRQLVESGIFEEVSEDSDVVTNFSTVEFTLKLSILGMASHTPLELTVEFPVGYPLRKNIYLFFRCDALKCAQLEQLCRGAHEFLRSRTPGNPQVVDVVVWSTEKLAEILQLSSVAPIATELIRTSPPQMGRWWIHSHHICGKAKRQMLPKEAERLDLTGFLLTGKPGIICVEGSIENVKEFWDRIRIWAWKKIEVRNEEICGPEAESFLQFGRLKELSQMSMTAFKQYLTDHNCGKVFPVLFGLNSD